MSEQNTAKLSWEERVDLRMKIGEIHIDKNLSNLSWNGIFAKIHLNVYGRFEGEYLIMKFTSEEEKLNFMMKYVW